MNRTQATATLKAAQQGLGPEQMPRTAPAGATVRVIAYTTDGQAAYISYGGSCGYTPVSNLADVTA